MELTKNDKGTNLEIKQLKLNESVTFTINQDDAFTKTGESKYGEWKLIAKKIKYNGEEANLPVFSNLKTDDFKLVQDVIEPLKTGTEVTITKMGIEWKDRVLLRYKVETKTDNSSLPKVELNLNKKEETGLIITKEQEDIITKLKEVTQDRNIKLTKEMLDCQDKEKNKELFQHFLSQPTEWIEEVLKTRINN